MRDDNLKYSHLNNWSSLSLKLGVAISLILVIIGLILIGTTGAKGVEPIIPLSQLPQEILALNAMAIITTGILILLLTPILQVVVAIVTFSRDRDRLYLSISLILLCILVSSLLLALM